MPLPGAAIITGDIVDTSTLGTYIIYYDVTDENGNIASTVSRTVIVSDTTLPVIAGVSNQSVNSSQASDFIVPITTVTDNVDSDLSAIITYYKADGITVIVSLSLAQDELELGNDIILRYNAIDSSLNEAVEVVVTVTAIDDIDPLVTGVTDEEIYEKGSEVTIVFNEGNALLNDEEYISGTVITEKGEYTIVVTDISGNVTTMSFEIEGSNNVVIYSVVGIVVVAIGAGLYIMKIKHII